MRHIIEPEMISIPKGTFLMGSPEGKGYEDEHPQHQVTIQPFYMGKYPITQAQWRVIAKKTELKVQRDLDPAPSSFKGDDLPVEQINWYDADEFCKRLSKLTGKDYQLPSEAEWEYASRAGTQTPFFFGDDENQLKDYAWHCDNADKKTHPVGQLLPNAFGLHDMYGNVWEWCADIWHNNYDYAPTDGSAWLEGDEDNRSSSPLRGGAWSFPQDGCKSTQRFYEDKQASYYDTGFRVICGKIETLSL